jgi:STE24 endopeptidase
MPPAATEALAYHLASNWFWSLDRACALAVPLALLITGWGGRLHGLAARISGGRRVASVALFAALFFLLDRLVRLPISYRWDRAYEQARGIESPALATWAVAHARGWIFPIVGMTLLAALGYWLMAANRRWWWLWATGAGSLVILALLLAEPLTQSHRSLDRSPLGDSLAEVAARAGIPREAIVVEHCEPASSCPPGRVIGLGPTRLMLLNDARMAENPESWSRSTVAHEAKHFAKDDNVKAFVLLSALLLVGLGFVHLAASVIIARWSRPLGFDALAHPASLPLVVLLLGAFQILALPPVNAFRQHVELEADRFALELTRDNQAQEQMLANSASEKGRVPEWSWFFRAFRATHPSDTERIRLAKGYHPWLEGKPLVYENDFAALPSRK